MHFSSRVYSAKPPCISQTLKGVQSSAFADFCPSIVLECGQAGEADGISHSIGYLEQILNLEHIPEGNPNDLNLYHTIARVTIPSQFSYGTQNDNDLTLLEELEPKNFHELLKNSTFAKIKNSDVILNVINESSEDVTSEFFEITNKQVKLKRPITLSMYTTNTKAISLDCLCYFMEKIHID